MTSQQRSKCPTCLFSVTNEYVIVVGNGIVVEDDDTISQIIKDGEREQLTVIHLMSPRTVISEDV
jgi:hypothetical protein